MRKRIIIIVGLLLMIAIGYWVVIMLPFVKGVKQDAKEKKHLFLRDNDTVISINKTDLDAIKKNHLLEAITLNSMFIDTTIQMNESNRMFIKRVDSVRIKEYFIDKTVYDSICLVKGNRHSEAIGVENFQSKLFGEFFKRDSTGFYVKLKNKQWIRLELDRENDEADHTFEYLFKKHGFYSIRVQWGEGNGYKLINYNNGEVTRIIGRPYFSPNGKYIISINSDLEAGYSYNGFQLIENKNGDLKELILYEPNNWGPSSAKWINNSKVITRNERIYFENDTMESLNFYTEIDIINGG